jgi:TetR/AcrR family transcriptional regulator
MKRQSAADAPVRVRNPERTREKILAFATEEFAARGYDGARVDAIVARCGISKNLLYHYFDSKEALFIRVMERAYAAMRERQNQVLLGGDDPVADMRTLVVAMVEHFAAAPDFIALLATENIHKAEHIAKSQAIQAMYNPLRASLRRLVRDGQARGVFRADVDWVDLYISISGMASYFVSNRYTLATVLDARLDTPARLRRRMQHVPDMVLAYLTAGTPAAQRSASRGPAVTRPRARGVRAARG